VCGRRYEKVGQHRRPWAPAREEALVPVIDLAVYTDGRRLPQVADTAELYGLRRSSGGMAWLGLYRPSESEMEAVAAEFDLHPLAVEDAVRAHQRPKTEQYGETRFTVLRPARYDDVSETVVFSELHVFTGPDFVVTVRHAATEGVGAVRQRLEASPRLLAQGPEAVLYAVLDQVVDEYGPVIAGLEQDVDEIEDQLFGGEVAVSRRIYELSREVIEFQRATHPLVGVLDEVWAATDTDGVDKELRRSLRDVRDHVVRVVERADAFRALLQNALQVNSTLVGERQNEEMRSMTAVSLAQNEEVKRISAWAAIFFAPTVVAGIYGMNFQHMPELGWLFGYPASLGLMIGGALLLRWVFRRRRWL
jgi:magnesium transporter